MRRLIGRFQGPIAACVGAAVFLVAAVSTYWDIATHIDVGRERFLTPAHIGIYAAVLVSAIAIALSGLADHLGADDSFFVALRHPFRGLRPGIGVAGAGMLTTLAAAPFDNAWHEIYGIDVTIWSPPHLLAIFGIASAALGLAALVAPAVHGPSVVYPLQLTGFLTALLITAGEFDFNAPQFRIAYHPIILAASSALVFTAAAGGRWRATKVALWFELVRVVAFLYLLAMGRSLAFVPVLVLGALAADLLGARGTRVEVTGIAIAAVTVVSNWLALELLPGLRWPVDDLLLATPFALIAGAIGGWLGGRLGARLNGEPRSVKSVRVPRTVSVAVLFGLVVLVAVPALAHEVGSRRGEGIIQWSPRVPEAGQTIEVQISDLSLDSGDDVNEVQIEARRAEHRVAVPLTAEDGKGTVELSLPEQGLWFLFVRTEARGEHLLWGDHFTVADDGAGESGVERQRFTLGVDSASTTEQAAWIDWIAYGIALVLMLLLVRGVIRALNRLPQRPIDTGVLLAKKD